MKLYKPLFSITPEALKSIDVDLAYGEAFAMVNPQMSVSAKHKGIIAFEFIGIHNRTSSDGFYCHLQNRFGSHIFKNLNLNNTVPLQNTENRDFIKGSPATFAFTFAAKIGFIKLYLAIKKIWRIYGISYNGNPNKSNCLKNSRIAQFNLLGYLSGRHLKFKELYNPKPFLIRYLKPIKPSAGKVMELIAAPFAPVSFTPYSVDFIAPAPCAKNMAVFPAVSFKIKTCFIFGFPYEFKCV